MNDQSFAGLTPEQAVQVQADLEQEAQDLGFTLRCFLTDEPDGKVTLSCFVVPPQGVAVAETLGELSRRYEVGTRGVATISTGVGDKGGKSYGLWQMTSANGGTVGAFVSEPGFPHAADFAGLAPGSAAFDAAWQAVAARDPAGFKALQHAYILRTHYEVVRQKLRAQGIDIAARSHTLQDVLWSTAVQHRNNAVDIFAKARAAVGEGADDAAFIKAVYAERGRRDADGSLARFKSSSAEVQRGVARRFTDEQADALANLAKEGAKPPPTPAATGATPKWMQIARQEEGQAEMPGGDDNPRIRAYHAWTSLGEQPDAVPWCGAFVSFCLGTAGVLRKGTGFARAADWMKYGEALDAPREGCLVVLQPQSPGASGHVGFWVKTSEGRIHLLGGNQQDRVSVAAFKADQVRKDGYRWPSAAG